MLSTVLSRVLQKLKIICETSNLNSFYIISEISIVDSYIMIINNGQNR